MRHAAAAEWITREEPATTATQHPNRTRRDGKPRPRDSGSGSELANKRNSKERDAPAVRTQLREAGTGERNGTFQGE